MVDGFLGLRHHAVIGGHDQDHDIRHLRAARAHARESFMARCVHEHHAAVVHQNFVGSDVLGDSPGFTCGHLRFANGVQEARFSVVYVAHNGYDRGPRFQTFLSLFLRDFQNHFLFQGHDAYDAIEGFRQRRRRGHIERLVDAGKHAAVEQRFQQVFRAHVELLRELANGDAFGDGHFARRTRFGRCNHRRGGRRPAA